MQEIDTWTAAGWRDSDSFAHYVQAKMMMKQSMDAAHARGMLIRPVTNSILRLAQMPEALLEARIAAPMPGAGPARKAAERSQQRDALALLVRRLVKRTMKVNANQAQDVDGNANPPTPAQVALYSNGALSSICMRKLYNVDILHEGALEHAKNVAAGVADTWENAPYYMARNSHGNNQQHEHQVGVTAHYLESILLPGRHALRHDINAVMAFSSTQDGKDFVPVGIVVYGACIGTVESDRHTPGSNDQLDEHAQRFESDYLHFVPKSVAELQNIAQPEHPNLFEGNVPNPGNLAHVAFANDENQKAVLDHGAFYQQYQAVNVPANLHPSELQHRVYEKRVAEIYVLCAQDPLDLAYQRAKAAALQALPQGANMAAQNAAISALPRPQQNTSGWGSMLLSFSLSFIASERMSIEARGVKQWIPKYSAVVMELAPDSELVDEAPIPFQPQATRSTQLLRGIAKRMGFTPQPIIKTDVNVPGPGNSRLPMFAQSNLGNPWQKSLNEYVSLYFPGRDYFQLSFIGESLPTQIKAENNALLGNIIERGAHRGICPSVRGLGIVKCS